MRWTRHHACRWHARRRASWRCPCCMLHALTAPGGCTAPAPVRYFLPLCAADGHAICRDWVSARWGFGDKTPRSTCVTCQMAWLLSGRCSSAATAQGKAGHVLHARALHLRSASKQVMAWRMQEPPLHFMALAAVHWLPAYLCLHPACLCRRSASCRT